MPFASQKQRAFLYSKHPRVAAKFEKDTPKGSKLPRYAPTKGKKHSSGRAIQKRKAHPMK